MWSLLMSSCKPFKKIYIQCESEKGAKLKFKWLKKYTQWKGLPAQTPAPINTEFQSSQAKLTKWKKLVPREPNVQIFEMRSWNVIIFMQRERIWLMHKKVLQ